MLTGVKINFIFLSYVSHSIDKGYEIVVQLINYYYYIKLCVNLASRLFDANNGEMAQAKHSVLTTMLLDLVIG